MHLLFAACNIRTPDRHDGSVIGFTDSSSSQKLLLHQHQSYQPHHNDRGQVLADQQHRSSASLVNATGVGAERQYHQINDANNSMQSHHQYGGSPTSRSPSSPVISVKSSASKHSRIGEYQGRT